MATTRYSNTDEIKREDKKMRGTTIFIAPPESLQDIYIESVAGDRMDILSMIYYKSKDYWYIIAAANPNIKRDSLFIEPGLQVRIPLPLNNVLRFLEQQNSNR